MISKHDRKRDSAFDDGLKQRIDGVGTVLNAVAKAQYRTGTFQLVAKQDDQVGGIVVEDVRFAAENKARRYTAFPAGR